MITKENIIDCYLFLRENNQSIPSEVLEFIKGAALEKLDKINSDDAPTITDGCYCTDIKTEDQYHATCEALIKLGAKSDDIVGYFEFSHLRIIGWDKRDGRIYDTANNVTIIIGALTTLMSHRDIIKAAEGL